MNYPYLVQDESGAFYLRTKTASCVFLRDGMALEVLVDDDWTFGIVREVEDDWTVIFADESVRHINDGMTARPTYFFVDISREELDDYREEFKKLRKNLGADLFFETIATMFGENIRLKMEVNHWRSMVGAEPLETHEV